MMIDSHIPRVVAVVPESGRRLRLSFDDGLQGVAELDDMLTYVGALAPLTDPAFFATAAVDHDAGTVAWAGGVDLDPVVLHEHVARKADAKGPRSRDNR